MREILHQRWPWGVAAGIAVLLYLAQAVQFTKAHPRPAGTLEDVAALRDRNDINVLFVLIDTLRSGHLSGYGYERETSPKLDRIAASGARFARHVAQSSWTKCSMASLWTGAYPVRTRVTRFDHVLPDEAIMPAEILADAGFRVAGLWRNGWVDPSFGFGQGFEVYERPKAAPTPPSLIAENPTVSVRGSDFDLVDSAREFLRVNGQDRWFLYLHMMDVHEFVYDAQTAVFGTDNVDLYDNAVLRIDAVIEYLFQMLREMGHADDTLVVIASDHGEAFGERGYEGHARAVYPESTLVPLIISFPFRLELGIVVAHHTENVDIWPTLLDLLGLPPLPDPDGRSRVPELLAGRSTGADPSNGDAAYSFLDQTWGRQGTQPSPSISVERGDYRYVFGKDSRGIKTEQLFERDGLENMAEHETALLEEMRGLASQHLESQPAWPEAPQLEMDEIQLNQLRALGYSLP